MSGGLTPCNGRTEPKLFGLRANNTTNVNTNMLLLDGNAVTCKSVNTPDNGVF